MMLLDQAIEERLIPGAPDLLKVQLPKLAQPPPHGRGVNQHGSGPLAPHQRVGRRVAHRRQHNLTCPVEHQQQTPADHIARRPVGLLPPPGLAQLLGQRPPAGTRVFGDELLDEDDLCRANVSAPISPRRGHA
jgi:hypothetical protein